MAIKGPPPTPSVKQSEGKPTNLGVEIKMKIAIKAQMVNLTHSPPHRATFYVWYLVYSIVVKQLTDFHTVVLIILPATEFDEEPDSAVS